MRKLFISTYKELLLLSRDIGGLAILFIMPLILVVTITLIQDSSFKTIHKTKIPILLVDNDNDNISKSIINNLSKNKTFKIVTKLHNIQLTEKDAKKAVHKGEYQLAVIIPKNMTSDLNKKINQNVATIMAEFGIDEEKEKTTTEKIEPKEIKLYFDPASQSSFREAVLNGIDKMISKIESKSIYTTFQKELSEEGASKENSLMNEENFITFRQINPKGENKALIPNSTQHNVPAWTLFAIFFIIVPLSINIVKEKSQGTFVRLRTNPVSYATVLGGKTITYLLVSTIQFLLMLAVGIYLLPQLGLHPLEITTKSFILSLAVAIFSGLAAIGFGLLLGTIAKTQEQSAPFGATAVVLLAAVGGVWVPVFIMPKIMQVISNLSPMNWGLSAFYDVFLREQGFLNIVPEILCLLLFFIITTTISIIYDHKKRTV